MSSPPRPVLSDDESDASSGLPVIFSNNASDTDFSATPSDPESSSESESESEEESQDELDVDDEDEQQLSPEYFLQEAESLDVSQLRQKRYSPKTQERLDETRDLWEE